MEYGSIFMLRIKILPPAEMGPEADPLLRVKGGNAALRGGEGWKEDKMPGWMAMGCFAPQGRIANCQDA